MSLRCAVYEVAIYLPPGASSELPASESLARCRGFLADLLGAAPNDVAVYDDRDAVVRVTPGVFFDKVEGSAPAFEALVADVERGAFRVVLVADVYALGRLPGKTLGTQRLEDHVQIVEAALVLSQRPDPAALAALHEGRPAAWAPYLEALIYRRMKAPRGRPSHVTAPAPLVEAFLARDTIEGWCRIAADSAPRALPTHGPNALADAVRRFESWLRESVGALGPTARAGGPKGEAEASYWKSISDARRAIEDGRWDDALAGAQAADELGKALPEEARARTETQRLTAAAHMGRGAFADALDLLASVLLREALFGRPWTPSEPVRIVMGLSVVEDALRHGAWLCTRTPSMEHPEWSAALDRLHRALDPHAAAALAAARSKYPVKSTRATKAAASAGPKPARRPKRAR